MPSYLTCAGFLINFSEVVLTFRNTTELDLNFHLTFQSLTKIFVFLMIQHDMDLAVHAMKGDFQNQPYAVTSKAVSRSVTRMWGTVRAYQIYSWPLQPSLCPLWSPFSWRSASLTCRFWNLSTPDRQASLLTNIPSRLCSSRWQQASGVDFSKEEYGRWGIASKSSGPFTPQQAN